MKKKFDVYGDDGHAWLKVERTILDTLGISDLITSFSYMKNGYVFLEEDCDASTFVGAYEKMYGIRPQYRYHHTDKQSRIRNYNHFSK